MSDALIRFRDVSGLAVTLPVRSVSHWATTPAGALRIWPIGGDVLHASDAPAVLAQLEQVFGGGARREARGASSAPKPSPAPPKSKMHVKKA